MGSLRLYRGNTEVKETKDNERASAADNMIEFIRSQGPKLPRGQYTLEGEKGQELVYKKVLARDGFADNWRETFHVIGTEEEADKACFEYIQSQRSAGQSEYRTVGADGKEG